MEVDGINVYCGNGNQHGIVVSRSSEAKQRDNAGYVLPQAKTHNNGLQYQYCYFSVIMPEPT